LHQRGGEISRREDLADVAATANPVRRGQREDRSSPRDDYLHQESWRRVRSRTSSRRREVSSRLSLSREKEKKRGTLLLYTIRQGTILHSRIGIEAVRRKVKGTVGGNNNLKKLNKKNDEERTKIL